MKRRTFLKTVAVATATTTATTPVTATNNTEQTPDELTWTTVDESWRGTPHATLGRHAVEVNNPDVESYTFTSDVDYAHHDPTETTYVHIETTTPVDVGSIDVVNVSDFEHDGTTNLVVVVAADDPVMRAPARTSDQFTTGVTIEVTDHGHDPSEIDNIQIRFDAFTPKPWSTHRLVPFHNNPTPLDYTDCERHVTLTGLGEAFEDYENDDIGDVTLGEVIDHYEHDTDVLFEH